MGPTAHLLIRIKHLNSIRPVRVNLREHAIFSPTYFLDKNLFWEKKKTTEIKPFTISTLPCNSQINGSGLGFKRTVSIRNNTPACAVPISQKDLVWALHWICLSSSLQSFVKGWKNHKISLCCSVHKCYKWLTQYEQNSKSDLLQHAYLTVIKSTSEFVDIRLLF